MWATAPKKKKIYKLLYLLLILRRNVRKADNLPPSCAVVMKSGNLNFLEPSEPLQACKGTALPLSHLNLIMLFTLPKKIV